MKETHLDQLKSHLSFLTDKYDFLLNGELYSPEFMGNAFVKYLSECVGIFVVCDRNQVFVQIGLKTWPENEWFQLEDIVRYFYPDLEKVYLFDKSIDDQLEQITLYLRGICEPFILGDFSMQAQVKEVEKQRVKEMLRNFGIDSDINKG